MLNPGDKVHFYESITELNVVMIVRYALSYAASGEVTYLCCYQDDNHVVQNIEALESELTLVP